MAEPASTIQFGSTAEAESPGVQMAPLIDIVFLLICFYLLVTQLISDQNDPTVELPPMATETAEAANPAEIVINLRADGGLLVSGRRMDLSGVRSTLTDSIVRARQADESIRVVIRADRRQRYGALDEVMELCREFEIGAVILRAQEGAGE